MRVVINARYANYDAIQAFIATFTHNAIPTVRLSALPVHQPNRKGTFIFNPMFRPMP